MDRHTAQNSPVYPLYSCEYLVKKALRYNKELYRMISDRSRLSN